MEMTDTQVPRLVTHDAAAARDVLGIVVTPLVGNAETGDRFGLFHALVPPGAGIPLHHHPDVEMFYLVEGELSVLREVGGALQEFSVRREEGGFIPAGAPHGFVNKASSPARALITCTRGLEDFLMEAGQPVRHDRQGPPSPSEIEQVLAIARRHGQVFPSMR